MRGDAHLLSSTKIVLKYPSKGSGNGVKDEQQTRRHCLTKSALWDQPRHLGRVNI